MTHVNKETAIALKEAGFDVETNQYYSTDDNDNIWDSGIFYSPNGKLIDNSIPAPTLDNAVRWLREVKGLHVVSVPDVGCHDKRWCYKGYVRREDGSWDYEGISKSYPTHDLALSAGIDKALNILKERNDGTNKD